MASGNLTLVCSQLRRPSQKGTELKPCPVRHRLPNPRPSQLLAGTSDGSRYLPWVGSHESCLRATEPLRLARRPPGSSRCAPRRGSLSKLCDSPPRVQTPFPHPRGCRRALGPRPPWAAVNFAAANAGARTPLRVPASRPFGSVPRSGTAGFSADSAFNSSEGAPAVFRGGCACHSESFDVRCWGRWGRSLVRDVGVTAG